MSSTDIYIFLAPRSARRSETQPGGQQAEAYGA
jgi:hypothetical protein